MLSGVINFNKSPEMSSNKALGILKRILFQNNIVTKIGHFGTLDPIAEGVLPIACGRATRLFDYTLDKKKIYRAVFFFGTETDTLDRTGKIISFSDKLVTEEEILNACPSLCGLVMQTPPCYSAKNVDGVRAYLLARKGEEFALPPKKVYIESIRLLRSLGSNEFEFEIVCGGGTYIRSIVRDLAAKLGTVGIMTSLIRTASGPFSIENAVTVEEFAEDPLSHVLPMDILLEDYPEIFLEEKQIRALLNGLGVSEKGLSHVDNAARYIRVKDKDGIAGIGVVNDGLLKMKTWLK